MTRESTKNCIERTIKVIQTSNSRLIVEGAIKRLSSYGFTKEQIVKVLETKTNKVLKA